MKHSEKYDVPTLNDHLREMFVGSHHRTSRFNGTYCVNLAHGFQQDYSRLMRHGDFDDGKSYRGEFGGLSVYLLRGDLVLLGHGTAECAVLENTGTGAHAVLLGERMKGNLDFRGGIRGFLTQGKNPVAEVRSLFRTWARIMTPLKEKHAAPNGDRYSLRREMRGKFEEIEFLPAAEKFLAPIPEIARLSRTLALSATPEAPASAKRPLSAPPTDPP